MLHEYFAKSWLPGAVLWALLFIASQLITIANGRLYRAGARGRFEWENSPETQSTASAGSDPFRLRMFSAMTLVGIPSCLAVVWFNASDLPFRAALYLALLGSCTLPLCTTVLRHFNNYLVFRGALDGMVLGKVTFSEKFARRASAQGLLCFVGFYLMLAAILGDWFCLGGALGCLLSSLREFERAQQLQPEPRERASDGKNGP